MLEMQHIGQAMRYMSKQEMITISTQIHGRPQRQASMTLTHIKLQKNSNDDDYAAQ